MLLGSSIDTYSTTPHSVESIQDRSSVWGDKTPVKKCVVFNHTYLAKKHAKIAKVFGNLDLPIQQVFRQVFYGYSPSPSLASFWKFGLAISFGKFLASNT